MEDTNYPQIEKEIRNWKGFETDYWKAVEICESTQKLNPTERKVLKAGLTPKSREIVEKVFKGLENEDKSFREKLDKRKKDKINAKSEAKPVKNT